MVLTSNVDQDLKIYNETRFLVDREAFDFRESCSSLGLKNTSNLNWRLKVRLWDLFWT